jgi:hypothetical protein
VTTASPTITVLGMPFLLHLLTRTRLSHVPTVLPRLAAMHLGATTPRTAAAAERP